MSGTESRPESRLQGESAEQERNIKPEPVDENSYTSLPTQEPYFDDDSEVKTRIKSEPQTEQKTTMIKQEPTANEFQDAEPLWSSKLPSRAKGEPEPTSASESLERVAQSNNTRSTIKGSGSAGFVAKSGRREVVDLTEEDLNDAFATAELYMPDATQPMPNSSASRNTPGLILPRGSYTRPRASAKSRLRSELRVDGTNKLRFGANAKTEAELAAEKAQKQLAIDATEKLSNPRFYKKSEFQTRIGPPNRDSRKTKRQREKEREAYSRAVFFDDDQYHPAARGSISQSLRRSERTVGQQLERVAGTHDSPRVEKSVKSKKAPSAVERNDVEKSVRKGIENGSVEVKGGKSTSIAHNKDAMFEDNGTLCICEQEKGGTMIECENKVCDIRWFHLECVGLANPPKGEWLCSRCTKLASKTTATKRTTGVSQPLNHRSYRSSGGPRSKGGAPFGSRSRSASRTRYVRTTGKVYRKTTPTLDIVSEEDEMEM